MNTTVINNETGEIVGNAKLNDDNNKKNRDYVMMYRKFINQIADLGQEDAQALKILLFLCRNMDSRNALCITMGLISEMTGMCRQTVSKKLKFLEDNGWICVAKLGKANVYIVNPEVVWTAYADDKTYCKFEATVMLDPKDNWEFKSKDKTSIRHIDRDILQKIAKEIVDEQQGETGTDTVEPCKQAV